MVNLNIPYCYAIGYFPQGKISDTAMDRLYLQYCHVDACSLFGLILRTLNSSAFSAQTAHIFLKYSAYVFIFQSSLFLAFPPELQIIIILFFS